MREPRQRDADRLAKLKSELTAIELRESDYYRVRVHDDIDAVAHRTRLKRREGLLGKIASIAGLHGRVFRLKVFLTNPLGSAVRLLRHSP